MWHVRAAIRRIWRSAIWKSILASAIARPTRRAIFDLAYKRAVFNGLLFIWGTSRIDMKTASNMDVDTTCRCRCRCRCRCSCRYSALTHALTTHDAGRQKTETMGACLLEDETARNSGRSAACGTCATRIHKRKRRRAQAQAGAGRWSLIAAR
jgi:hypothetical protein